MADDDATEQQQQQSIHAPRAQTLEAGQRQLVELRQFEAKKQEELIMLRPFLDVLTEDCRGDRMEQFILYRATCDPLAIEAWLHSPDGQQGLIRYIRDQCFPIVEEDVFVQWRQLLAPSIRRPEHLFWSFVAALFLDEGILKMVRETWPGSDRMWDCLLEYYHTKYIELLSSPFDPENGNLIMVTTWAQIQRDVMPMNFDAIIKHGKLKPVFVPLSRNAHRLRRQEIRQAEHEEFARLKEGQEDVR